MYACVCERESVCLCYVCMYACLRERIERGRERERERTRKSHSNWRRARTTAQRSKCMARRQSLYKTAPLPPAVSSDKRGAAGTRKPNTAPPLTCHRSSSRPPAPSATPVPACRARCPAAGLIPLPGAAWDRREDLGRWRARSASRMPRREPSCRLSSPSSWRAERLRCSSIACCGPACSEACVSAFLS